MDYYHEQVLSKTDCFYLDSFFKQHFNESLILNLTRVHGFLSAIISSPTLVKPAEWTALILGNEPEFDSVAQAEKIMDLILELYKQISSQLRGVEPYSLLLWDGKASHALVSSPVVLLEDWCSGYLEGIKMDPLWETDRHAVSLLTPFVLFAKQYKGTDKECSYHEDRMFGYRMHLASFVEDNYAYWFNEREEEISFCHANHQTEVKCSCGSKINFQDCLCLVHACQH